MKATGMVFVLLLVTLSCKTSAPNSSSPVSPEMALNDIWVLIELNGVPVTADDFSRQQPQLEFHHVDNTVLGHTGCNNLSGKYTAKRSALTFGPLITTKMACPGDGEQRFLTALQHINAYRIENLRLYLSEGSNVKAIFKKVD